MSEHAPEWTPGPWKVVDSKGAGLQIHANPGKRDFGVYKWDGEKPLMIFTLRRESPHIGIADERWMQFPADEWDAMQAANARLIAAAPLLVEACRAARDALTPSEAWDAFKAGEPEPTFEGRDEACEILSAALAAVGE